MSSDGGPLSFVECPYEILINILKRVDSKDIIALGLTCRRLNRIANDSYLWHMLCCCRFDEYVMKKKPQLNNPNSETDWKKTYFELGTLIKYAAPTARIAWLEDPDEHGLRPPPSHTYWSVISDPRSSEPCVVVFVTFDSVPYGTYDVIWRIIAGRGSNLDCACFETRVVDPSDDTEVVVEPIVEFRPSREDIQSVIDKKDWTEYRVPKPVVVSESDDCPSKLRGSSYTYRTVIAKLYSHDSTMHSGLHIDYVRLEPHKEDKQ
ncbi:8429_t:CDS:2 [Paraglomus occultum]|uniref:8429_t:CDS:1 n=1 Tax=Paraglomus occultum TaxID=144539 RepID=A0A9N9A2J4_9GLOM|nr:8429_t:CDS:2 [Paraglomus occultum]